MTTNDDSEDGNDDDDRMFSSILNGEDGIDSYRPSLRRLTLDAERLIHGYKPPNDAGAQDVSIPGLAGGFENRADIVRWEQRLCIRTLGEIPEFVLQGLATQLVGPHERPIIEVLLTDSSLADETQQEWRERIRQKLIHRSFDRAFKRLRKDSTEYVATSDDDETVETHDPAAQSHIAMRPGLVELDKWQHETLEMLLNDGDGFENRAAILDWMPLLENATHGESIQFSDDLTMPVSEFVDRWHDRDPMAEVLTAPDQQRNREAFAARFLIPTFQAGVRQYLAGSKEIPNTIVTEDSEGGSHL